MIAVVVVLVVALVLLDLALLYILRSHLAERAGWAQEREMLVNRVVARHTGEVIALDREARPREPREPREPTFIEGLS